MKTSKNQAVMPINVAAMIDENDPVFNRKSYSKTDREATFMRMKDDHMGNGQLKPGYNLQICVESEYIVGLGLFSNPNDTTTLLPFLERTAEGTGRRYGNIVADAGYASEENYTYLESMEQNTYIKPADHELKKTRKFKKKSITRMICRTMRRVTALHDRMTKDCFMHMTEPERLITAA